MAKRAPHLLLRILFASAQGQDKTLAQTPEPQAFIRRTLQQCFVRDTTGYTRDIRHYLKPWSARVIANGADVCLWHGTEDNWSPFAMCDYLAEYLPGNARIERMAGLSHYSCLHATVPLICVRLAGGRGWL